MFYEFLPFFFLPNQVLVEHNMANATSFIATSNRLKTIFTFIDFSCSSYEKKRVNGTNPKPVSSLQGAGPDLQNPDPSFWDPDSYLHDPDSGLQKTNSDLPKLELSLQDPDLRFWDPNADLQV